MIEKIKEGDAVVKVGVGKISKKLEVFYNRVMKFNRDMSILVLGAVHNKDMQICLPLAASGVRGIRFFKELKKGKIRSISFNDHSDSAFTAIKMNLKFNDISDGAFVSKKDASIFLLESSGFDYIDIDPFGSPNPFLDSSVKRLSRDGILAVTATDTSSLCGTYPESCLRKYWARPFHGPEMQEIGLRILIRKAQLVAAQYEKALVPIFSYSKDHYMRVFFRCDKGKKRVDELMPLHGFYKGAGPVWLGQLFDRKLVKRMAKINEFEDIYKFLDIMKDELDVVGFYEIHEFCKSNKLDIPKRDGLIKAIRRSGFKASLTTFCDTAVKSDIKEDRLRDIIKDILSKR